MIPGLPLAFAEPLVLLGLLSLPILWWLLRLVPPRPRRIDFPPTRMLFDIAPKEETPARTPWWLTLLRLTLAALVIIAAAGPLWNPPVATTSASAPLLLMIDDGFAAASTWDARMRTAEDLIARAEADGRGVALVPMSAAARDISLETPGAARARLRLVKPKPHAVERTEFLPALERFLKAHAGRRDRLAGRRRRSRPCRRFRHRAGAPRRQSADHRGRRRHQAGACADRRRQCGGRAFGKSAARRDRRRRCRRRARARSQGIAARRSAVLRSSRASARPKRNSTCRSKSATTLPGSKSTASTRPAPCSFSTSDGGGAPSASSPARPPTPPSRCLPRPIYLAARSIRSPMCGLPTAHRHREAVSQFIEQRLPMMILADVGTVAGEARERLDALDR